MPDDKALSRLTRSLLTGSSLGVVALVQVGCTELPGGDSMAASVGPSSYPSGAIVVASEAEAALCRAALSSRSVSAVERLMTSYPSSRCIAPVLNSLPASTLAAISDAAVAGLDPSVTARLSQQTRANLQGAGGSLSERVQEIFESQY